MSRIRLNLSLDFIADIVIFLGFMDFLGFHHFILFMAFLLKLVAQRRTVFKVNVNAVLLILWTLAYMMWIYINYGGTSSKFIIPVGILLAYFCGNIVVEPSEYGETKERFMKYLLMVISAVTIHGLLNVFINVRKFGINLNYIRELYDVWSGVETLSTGQAALFIPVVGMIYYLLVYSKADAMNPRMRIFLIASIIIGLAYNIMNATRMVPYVAIIIVFISILMDAAKERGSGKIKLIARAVIVLAIIIVLYNINIFNIKTFIENSGLMQRIERLNTLGTDTALTSKNRMDQWSDVVNNFSLYIWGGQPHYDFIHNTWLDLLNTYGIFVAGFFALFSVGVIFYTLKAARVLKKPNALLIIGITISIMFFMFLEPVFNGARWLIYLFCFYAGQVDSIVSYAYGNNMWQNNEEYRQ